MAEKEGWGDKLKNGALWAAPLVFVLVQTMPLPTLHLEGEAYPATDAMRVVLGLALWMAIWWMTEAVNLAVTSLLPLIVLPFCGVMPANKISLNYFQDSIVLFLGGFCLALAMERSGLHRRIALRVVRIFGTQPRRLVLGFLVASAVLSMWVSNTATSLMLIPVALTVASAVVHKEERDLSAGERSFMAASILAVAYGASMGGVGTLIGTPPNVLLAGYVNEHVDGIEITFGRWMMIGLPIVALMLPVGWLVLTRYGVRVPKRFEDGLSREELTEKLSPKSKLSFAEWAVMLIFFSTAFMWITHQEIALGSVSLPLTGWDQHLTYGMGRTLISDGTIAMLAGVLLMVLPKARGESERLLPWDYAQARLPWGTLLLFGGGLALAAGFDASGLNEYLKAAFGDLSNTPVWLIFAIIIVGMTILSELASNTAATTMILPVLAVLGAGLGGDPVPFLVAGTLGASSGYMLPVATPPNAVAFATGKLSVAQMIRAGFLVDIAVAIIMWLAVLLIAPAVF